MGTIRNKPNGHAPLANIVEEGREAFTQIMGCRSARKHRELWARLILCHWYEAIELGRVAGIGAQTGHGIAHLLTSSYDPKHNAKKRMRVALRFIKACAREAEYGRDVRAELEPLADELGFAQPLMRGEGETVESEGETVESEGETVESEGETKETRGETKESEGENSSLTILPAADNRARTLLTATPNEPFTRSQAMQERARRLAIECPPPEVGTGRNTLHSIRSCGPTTRAEWVAWVATISQRWAGPLYAHDIRAICGEPMRWCEHVLREFRASLASGLSMDQRRSHALSLASEAEAIAREALALSMSEDERTKSIGLKLALDALDRRARLIGADKIQFERPVEAARASWNDRARDLGYSADDLRAVADIASRAMSRRRVEDDDD